MNMHRWSDPAGSSALCIWLRRALFVPALLACGSALGQAAPTLYVGAGSDNGSVTGTLRSVCESQLNTACTLADAITYSNATVNGTVVIELPLGNFFIRDTMKVPVTRDVTIRPRLPATNPGDTVISCDVSGSSGTARRPFLIGATGLAPNVTLQGFTVSNCVAQGGAGAGRGGAGAGFGGAVLVHSGNLTLSHMRFSANQALGNTPAGGDGGGGGLFGAGSAAGGGLWSAASGITGGCGGVSVFTNCPGDFGKGGDSSPFGVTALPGSPGGFGGGGGAGSASMPMPTIGVAGGGGGAGGFGGGGGGGADGVSPGAGMPPPGANGPAGGSGGAGGAGGFGAGGGQGGAGAPGGPGGMAGPPTGPMGEPVPPAGLAGAAGASGAAGAPGFGGAASGASAGMGGAVFVRSGALTVRNSTFLNNTATRGGTGASGFGGAVFVCTSDLGNGAAGQCAGTVDTAQSCGNTFTTNTASDTYAAGTAAAASTADVFWRNRTNSMLDSSALATPCVPNAPTAVSAARGNAQAAVSFTTPTDDGGSPITGYRFTPHSGSPAVAQTGLAQTCTLGPTQTCNPFTVTGLTNGTAVQFAVAALTANGAGLQSALSTAVTPATVPGPVLLASTTVGDRSFAFETLPQPNNGGDPIVQTFAAFKIGTTPQVSFSSPAIPWTRLVTGFTNGVTYNVTFEHSNGVGLGAPTVITFTPAAPPDPPTAVAATAGELSLSVAFAPPVNTGGIPVTSYRATCTPTTAGAALNATGAASPITVAGLLSSLQYTCTVRASHAVSSSAESTASAAARPFDPSPPPPPSVPSTGGTASPGAGTILVINPPPPGSGGPPTIITLPPPGGAPITLQLPGGVTLQISATSADATLSVVNLVIGNTLVPVIEVRGGSVAISGSTVQGPQLLVGGTLLSSAGNTCPGAPQLQVVTTTAGSRTLAVTGPSGCALSFGPSTLGRASPSTSGTLRPGQLAEFDSDGRLARVRLGSIDGKGELSGDPQALVNRFFGTADLNTQAWVSRVDKPAPGSTTAVLNTLIAGLPPEVQSALRYRGTDFVSGVLRFVNTDNASIDLVAWPLGVITVSPGSASASLDVDGTALIQQDGLGLRLAPAPNDLGDLTNRITQAGGKVTLQANGILRIQLTANAAPLVVRPDWWAPTATTPAGVVQDTNGITHTAQSGRSQRLNGAAADTQALLNLLKASDAQAAIATQANAALQVTLNGLRYTLAPQAQVIAIPTAQAGRPWWISGGTLYLPLTEADGRTPKWAQGFGLR